MKDFYRLDMSALDAPFEREQADYYIYSSLWTELRPEHLVGQVVPSALPAPTDDSWCICL